MNYAYIGRDVDSQDWVPLRDETGFSRLYKPTAQIIEDVMEMKQPGVDHRDDPSASRATIVRMVVVTTTCSSDWTY